MSLFISSFIISSSIISISFSVIIPWWRFSSIISGRRRRRSGQSRSCFKLRAVSLFTITFLISLITILNLCHVTFHESVVFLINSNPMCCFPSRCDAVRFSVSPTTRNAPQISHTFIRFSAELIERFSF
jgi:hypothetical protein